MIILPAAIALAGCASLGSTREAVTLIAPADGPRLLAQCSRPGPEGATDFFTLAPAEVTAIETATMAALRGAQERLGGQVEGVRPSPFDWPGDPSLYDRQYVGYSIGERRFAYGNFLPSSGENSAGEPVIVCDGGPAFFGAEYDLTGNRLVRIAFNGGLGGPFLDPIEP
ncbi:hypothetical protein [Erythrobacter sp.]|jgi:hypothetical protein|uniref:hypothetical protein n=1 Tax=Erythrobacter sp. TaxID=1042 RepID=UPI002E9A921A|nr:hypothetical protein [Erythrobacter sp.]